MRTRKTRREYIPQFTLDQVGIGISYAVKRRNMAHKLQMVGYLGSDQYQVDKAVLQATADKLLELVPRERMRTALISWCDHIMNAREPGT